MLGDIDDTEDVLEATGATGVLISLSSVESEVVNRLTRELTDAGYHVALSSGLRDIDVVRFRAQDLGGRTLIYVEQIQRGGWRGRRQAGVRHHRRRWSPCCSRRRSCSSPRSPSSGRRRGR